MPSQKPCGNPARIDRRDAVLLVYAGPLDDRPAVFSALKKVEEPKPAFDISFDAANTATDMQVCVANAESAVSYNVYQGTGNEVLGMGASGSRICLRPRAPNVVAHRP